jgi:HD-GYP domain-containing protein (c-di-GMP phosphodiesterase class II)
MNNPALNELQHLIRYLVTATANARLYAPDHPQIERLCKQARRCITRAAHPPDSVLLFSIEGEIIFQNVPLPGGLHTQRLARLLEQRSINRLEITPDIRTADLRQLVTFLTQKDATQPLPDIPHLTFETLADTNEHSAAPAKHLPLVAAMEQLSSRGHDRLAEIFEDVRRRRAVRVAGLGDIVTGFINAFSREIPSLLSLMPLRAMDEYTFTHDLNVCLLNLAQAMNLGITGELLHDIGVAALLHDVGKQFVPKDILNKPGKLDEREWAIMQQHPVTGAEYLLNCPGVPPLAVVTAFEHHVRYNLSGYPKVPPDWRQHLCSQMTTVSDIYDATRTHRPYSPPIPPERCAEILQNLAGQQVHPHLAANFLYLIDCAMAKA